MRPVSEPAARSARATDQVGTETDEEEKRDHVGGRHRHPGRSGRGPGRADGPDPPRDRWWVQPVVTVTVLTAFVAYASWAAFVNKNYYVGADPAPRPDLAVLLAVPHRELRARAAIRAR